MRDEDIGRIMTKLEGYWLINPHLRLGQLMYNMIDEVCPGGVFYIEDNKIEELLDAHG